MVFVHKNDYHVLQGNQTSKVLNIAFSCLLFEHIAELFDAYPNIRKIRLNSDIVHYYLKKIRTLTSCPDFRRSEIALKSILVSLIQEFLSEAAVPDSSMPQWFQTFLSQLEHVDIFTGEMEQIYALTSKTPAHISRTFKRYMNTTLTAYLLSLKINYASRLLTTTSLPILDLCFESGFHNLGYFYRCFKEKFGISPQKYRELYTVKI